MNKIEFLNNLRAALSSELPANEIESNIQFYNEYITTNMSQKSEEEILQELGDPRLIAKTIIETYQISHGTSYNGYRNVNDYREYQTSDNREDYNQDSNTSRNSNNKSYFDLRTSVKWYHKLLLVIVIIAILSLLFFLSSIAISVFLNFGIPVLIIYFGYKFISNSIRRR